jgi:DMSO/TMAO reductase YedYZ molybdopterin-dependent catalytic subunit
VFRLSARRSPGRSNFQVSLGNKLFLFHRQYVFSDFLSSKKPRLPPDQTATDHILRWGYDHPGITTTNPILPLETYTLTIDGEVEEPVTLNWKDFLALPQTVSVSDFHCVEGWSVLDCKWEGVKIKDIEKLVKPRAVARAVTFDCADNYRTSLFREELSGDDVLLACKLNGEALEEGLGAPVRLVVPSKYAYKSALWVTRLGFTRGKELGFWERRGYSDGADVWKNDRFRR